MGRICIYSRTSIPVAGGSTVLAAGAAIAVDVGVSLLSGPLDLNNPSDYVTGLRKLLIEIMFVSRGVIKCLWKKMRSSFYDCGSNLLSAFSNCFANGTPCFFYC